MTNDRDELRGALLGARRDRLLTWDEVREAGMVFYGSDQEPSLYGMRAPEWFAKGVRIVGRTAIEVSVDGQAAAMAAAAQRLLAPHEVGPALTVVDAFAGSGNILVHVARALGPARAIGFERSPSVFSATKENLARLAIDATCRTSATPELLHRRARRV
ncbi:hypothetical protein L6R52_04920 [Myxococcota bacterium]|nr:hypothetical protein [Myxococcota bacterium]